MEFNEPHDKFGRVSMIVINHLVNVYGPCNLQKGFRVSLDDNQSPRECLRSM